MSAGNDRGQPPGQVPPRRLFRLLADPVIGPYFASKVLASTGTWIYNIVAAIVVFDLSRSAFLVGAVSITQFTPQVLLAPHAGASADRRDRRIQLAVGRGLVGLGAACAALVVTSPLVEGHQAAYWVIGASSIVGIGFAVGSPAMHSLLPGLAKPSELPTLVAIDTAPFTIARAIGPAIGALLLTVTGPATAMLVAGLIQLPMCVVVLRLRPPERPKPKHRGSVWDAFRFVAQERMMVLVLLGTVGVGFAVDPVITLSPSIAADLGGDATLVAILASSFGVGAAATLLFIGPLQRRWLPRSLSQLGQFFLVTTILGLAFAPTPTTAVAILAVSGVGMMLSVTSFTTQLQQSLPDAMRGRVMALWTVCFVGSRPLAAAVNGAVADTFSVQAALLLLAAFLAALMVFTRPSQLV